MWRTAARTGARVGLIGVLVLASAAVGVAGSFVHRAQRPAGLALSLVALVGVMLLVRAVVRSRWGLGFVAAAWLVPVGGFAVGTSAGDVVVASDPVGLTFVLGGVLVVSLFLGMGASSDQEPGVQPVSERTSVS